MRRGSHKPFLDRFRIREEVQGFTPYRRFTVDWANFTRDLTREEERDPNFDRAEFLEWLKRYLTAMKLATDWDGLQDAETELLINSLSMLCPFSPEDKQALLEAPTLENRRETLVALIQFALRGGAEGDFLQ